MRNRDIEYLMDINVVKANFIQEINTPQFKYQYNFKCPNCNTSNIVLSTIKQGQVFKEHTRIYRLTLSLITATCSKCKKIYYLNY